MTTLNASWTITRTVGTLAIVITLTVTVNNLTQAQAQTIVTEGDSLAASLGTVINSNKTYTLDSVSLS